MLRHEPAFRYAVLGLILSAAGLALFLVRFWTVSPEGFRPILKLSGLELAQNWSLQRSASKLSRAGDWERASYTWRASVAKNPFRVTAVEGLLRSLPRRNRSDGQEREALRAGLWFLRITGTNANSLEIVAIAWEHFDQFEPLTEILGANLSTLSPPARLIYLRALFRLGRFSEFEAYANAELEGETEVSLCHAALRTIRGSPSEQVAGSSRIEAALHAERWRTRALRLRLFVAAEKGDSVMAEQSFHQLEASGAGELIDSVHYWQALDRSGTKHRAVELAKASTLVPRSGFEVCTLARLFLELGEPNLARGLLDRGADRFPEDGSIWTLAVHELVRPERWDELAHLGLKLRERNPTHQAFVAWSHLIEARAALATQRMNAARSALRSGFDAAWSPLDCALTTAVEFLKVSDAESALLILHGIQPRMKSDPEYWTLLFAAAAAARDEALMLEVSKRLIELQPNNLGHANNYAAMLLVTAGDCDQALAQTQQVLRAQPGSQTARINHAGALLLNNRPSEALQLLGQIESSQLHSAVKPFYYFNLLQAELALGDTDRARATLPFIDASSLYPSQQQRLRTWSASLAK